MTPPENVEIHHTKTGMFWFDEHGILYSVSLPNPPVLNEEEQKEQLDGFLKIIGDKKICMIIDAKHAKPTSNEESKKAAKILGDFTKAMAVIVHSTFGRIVVNLFIGLQKPSFPLKIFKPGEENKAKEWIKQYL